MYSTLFSRLVSVDKVGIFYDFFSLALKKEGTNKKSHLIAMHESMHSSQSIWIFFSCESKPLAMKWANQFEPTTQYSVQLMNNCYQLRLSHVSVLLQKCEPLKRFSCSDNVLNRKQKPINERIRKANGKLMR